MNTLDPNDEGAGVFDRVLCGIDETPQSLEALRQVERLRPQAGSLHLVTVAELGLAVHGGFAAAHLYDEIASGAEHALARAVEGSDSATSQLIEGEPVRALLAEIGRARATVVALGSHGQSRRAGILVGGTATTLLHEAPCSVLLARLPPSHGEFPASVLVGVDGSALSLRSREVASELGDRLGVPVRALAATGGKPVHFDGLVGVPNLEWDDRKPLDALIDASRTADLLVLGSRGLHGLAALGSVSERVAHEADCSVLVVRTL